MAGLTFGGVDLAGLGFEISHEAGSVRVSAPQIVFTEIAIPGRSGVVRFNPRLGPRQIFIAGYVAGLSQSTMMGNVFALESYLLGSLNTDPDPTNHVAPTITLKSLVIPSFGGKYFPDCECETWAWDFIPGRPMQNVCKFSITFKQSLPFTGAV